MFIEQLFSDLRNNATIFRKEEKKVIFLKFEDNKIYKRFMFGDLITDWAHSSINDKDIENDDWQIY